VDLLDRRIARRLGRLLPLADGEDILDFDIGVNRPYGAMPPPLPATVDEQARVEVVATPAALYLRVTSRSRRDGSLARVPWEELATFGPYKAEGRYRRWSLRGSLTDGTPLAVTLTGRPRASLLQTLAGLGVDPGDPGPRI
jgi:hypothetical protein